MLNLKVQHQQQESSNVVIDLKKQQQQQQVEVTNKKDDILKLPLTVEGSEGSDNIALFHRKEIEVGTLVGSGSFSEVFEISGFVDRNSTSNEKRKKMIISNLLLPRRTNSTTSTAAADNDEDNNNTMMVASRRRKRNDLIEQHNQNKRDMYTGQTLQSCFVIKHLHRKLLSDPKLYRRALKDLATEVTIMSSIEHPHIVQLHGTAIGGVNNAIIAGDGNGEATAATNHDGYFLILDRLHQTLDDRIESWNQEKIRIGPTYYLDAVANDAKMALKANYALQIASALRYLHERRIVFRDLKPQNIGFKEVHPDHPERDVLALFDFGLSRTLPSPTKANDDGLYKMSMVGTRRYMAPEVVTTRTYDNRADTYSWSLVFFELVTQCRPFDGIQRAEHKQFVCYEGKRPKIYDYYGLPTDLERLMRYSWAQDISKRLTMDEVCTVLQQYLVGTIHEDCVRQPPPPPQQQQQQQQQTATTTTTSVTANNSIIHDDSISSLVSNGTQNTEQTQSTTNSFTLDNHCHDKEEQQQQNRNHPTTTTTTTPTTVAGTTASVVNTAVIVPQAIAVGSVTAASSHAASDIDHDPEEDDDYHTTPQGRHVSLCERCVYLFRNRFGSQSNN